MSCCPSGSLPYATSPTDYEPKGEIIKLGLNDLPLYVVGPAEAEASVIVLPEVFGWSGRLKGICDSFAKEGYYVVLPDCHRGDTANGKPDIAGWVARTPWDPIVKQDFEAITAHIASVSASTKKIGAVGFCWGAWAGCKAAAEGVGEAERRLERLERSDSKSRIPPSYITNNRTLVASLLAAPG